jgi:F0F1-type ATP synthase assembly protein I
MSMEPLPRRKGPVSQTQQLLLAIELPFVMIGSVIAGGLVGYLLDRALHTAPVLLLAGGLLGLAGGIWEVIRNLSSDEKREKRENGSDGG